MGMTTMANRVFPVAMLLLCACGSVSAKAQMATEASLIASETAFAKSMADRNFEAFASFVDEGAVFVNGGNPLRGKAAVLEHWKKFFSGSEAPFAWKPVIAEVSVLNGLGYTEGPVSVPGGKVVTTFFTTWKLQADGSWRVIFDNGHDVCECAKQP